MSMHPVHKRTAASAAEAVLGQRRELTLPFAIRADARDIIGTALVVDGLLIAWITTKAEGLSSLTPWAIAVGIILFGLFVALRD